MYNIDGTTRLAGVTFSITPSLTIAGLDFNTGTGEFTGTPGVGSLTINSAHTVTVSNGGGSESVDIKISVKQGAPFGFKYPCYNAVDQVNNPNRETPCVITTKLTIPSANFGTKPIGAIVKQLNSGATGKLIIALTTTTTTVVLTPTTATPFSTTGGSYISIGDNFGSPANQIPTAVVLDRKGGEYMHLRIATNTPMAALVPPMMVDLGVTEVTVKPTSLPKGILLNRLTGVISGTLTEAFSGERLYTFVAKNSGGERRGSSSPKSIPLYGPPSASFSRIPLLSFVCVLSNEWIHNGFGESHHLTQ